MKRLLKSKWMIPCVILAGLIVCVLVSAYLLVSPTVTKYVLSKSRSEEAYLTPDFSGKITDVRITTRERELDFFRFTLNEQYQVKGSYQIYYGYCSDGVWYDIPYENYDLREISHFKKIKETGYAAADDFHIAKLGSYLLIAYPHYGDGNIDCDFEIKISDTLGSPVHEVTEYYTSPNPAFFNRDARYCQFTENMRTLDSGEFEYDLQYGSPKWYFVIVDFEQMTSDYTVTFRTHFYPEAGERIEEETLTYEKIQQAVA